MTGKQLKASLLQMAIEGKLVPQLDSEPAVEQIGDAPEEVPFAIPEKWKWVQLKNIVTVKGGKRVPVGKSMTKDNTGHIYLRVKDLKNMGVDETDIHYINDDIYDKISRYIITSDDIYITVAGTIGRVGIVPKKFSGANLTENADRLILSKYIEQIFLCYALHSICINNQIIEVTTKVGQPKLAIKNIEKLLFPLPPLAEQRRIVAKLEELLPLAEQFGAAQDKLAALEKALPAQLKASLLQEAIEGKLVPQLDSEPAVEQLGDVPEDVPFAIPDKWKWVKLLDAGHFISGYTPKKTELSQSGKIPYFKVSHMNLSGNECFLKNTDEFLIQQPKRTFAKNTIVYPKNGGAVFTNKRRILAQESVVDLNTGGYIPGRILNLKYIFLIFKTLDFRFFSKGTALPTIDQAKLKNHYIPLPPLAEQRRIVARLEELLNEVEKMG